MLIGYAFHQPRTIMWSVHLDEVYYVGKGEPEIRFNARIILEQPVSDPNWEVYPIDK